MGFRIHHASAALPLILILIAIIFIALTATSMISSETTSSQEDLDQYVDDAINELTSYIKIQHVYGVYSQEKPYRLTKIAIQATPLFHQEINLSTWILQLQTKTNLQLYTYNHTVSSLESSSVFSHSQWDQLKNTHFGIISIQDQDQSLTTFHSFNEPNDMAFFTLSIDDLSITKGQQVTLLLSPGTGIEKTITFQAPLPTKTVVNLW
jgi:archaellin